MAILPRYQRMQRRDWKDPFDWFRWFKMGKGTDPFFVYNGNNDPRTQGATYTGASVKTFYDASGTVQYAPMNLVKYSNDFTQASVWTVSSASVALNATGPSGSPNTANTVTATATGALVYNTAPTALLAAYPFSAQVKFKAGTGATYFYLNAQGDVSTHRAWFSLATGAVGTQQNVTASTTSLGNGWFLATIKGTTTNSYAPLMVLALARNDANTDCQAGDTALFADLQVENNPAPTAYQATTSAAVYAPRYAHYDPTQGGPTLLLEGSRANLVVQSDAVTAGTGWTLDGVNVGTAAYATAAGVSFTRLVPGAGDNAYRSVTFTGDGVKCFAMFVKQDAAVAGTFAPGILDNTASAWRFHCTVTVAANGVVTAVATAGTVLSVQALASGVYRILGVTTSVTAANANLFFATNSSAIASVLVAGCQAENGAFPSSYIPTTSAAVTRAADALSFPFAPTPQAMTVYADFVESGDAQSAGVVAYVLGGTGAAIPDLYVDATGGKYRANAWNGTTGVTSTAAAAPSLGNRVELRTTLDGTGAVTLGQSINGAAEAVAATSGANALAAAWSSALLTVAGGSAVNYIALRSLKIAAGVRRMNDMRWL